jgi:8-oxo-dGTP pyrophosphatase MutT (NUDIX family)
MKNTKDEVSAGGVLVRNNNGNPEALLIKVRHYGYELPKGHIETGESFIQAAGRELCEETSLITKPEMINDLGDLEYNFRFSGDKIHKRVYYFLFITPDNKPLFGQKPKEVKEIVWITKGDLEEIPLVNEELREIIRKAFSFAHTFYNKNESF